MATLEMAKFGPVLSAWEAARFNIAVSTSQQTGFNRLSAVETSKAPTTTYIGFWCDWSTGDGSLMMIGRGGSACARADHGIGITETDDVSFVDFGNEQTEFDFGYDAHAGSVTSQAYALNLWIR